MEREIINYPASNRAIEGRLAGRLTPALFAETDQAQKKFWEFFGGSVRNRNTRLAYVTAAYRFADWCEAAAADPLNGPALACGQLHRGADPDVCGGHGQAKSGRLAPAL